ncbi:MAG TPA: hypothetical protein VGS27_35300 [Candidatus Sulfotelmatobacter sp.]|nr:hypothetical protein [Candidatus Sulfotelmatobacter sp.]
MCAVLEEGIRPFFEVAVRFRAFDVFRFFLMGYLVAYVLGIFTAVQKAPETAISAISPTAKPANSKDTPRWKILLEILTALAIIAYTFVTYGIFVQQTDATNFAGRQAELSRKALNETIKNFVVDERAWVVARIPDLPAPSSSPDFRVDNIGKTIAMDVKGTVLIDVLPTERKFDFSEHVRGFPINLRLLNPKDQITFGVHMTEKIPNTNRRAGVEWTDKRNEAKNRGEIVVLGYGELSYRDIFSPKRHYVRFCRVLESHLVTRVSDSGVPELPAIWKQCEKENTSE